MQIYLAEKTGMIYKHRLSGGPRDGEIVEISVPHSMLTFHSGEVYEIVGILEDNTHWVTSGVSTVSLFFNEKKSRRRRV